MEFTASIPCSPPNAELYGKLKGVTPIVTQACDALPPLAHRRVPPILLQMVGPSMARAWMTYTFARLQAAALNHQGTFALPAAFPGRFLPAGAVQAREPINRGCLQIHWARHALEMGQPSEAAGALPRRMNGSGLEILSFPEKVERGAWEERRLREQTRETAHARDLGPAFTWTDRLWSPRQTLPPLRRDLVLFGRELLNDFRGLEQDSLALLLEVHDVVRRLEAHEALRIERIGIGVERGVWCEVGLIPLATIKATELVQTDRAIQELLTLYTRGFAPIVVNEWGCNTDGSHRQVAAWLWNALCDSKSRRREDLVVAVDQFIAVHRAQMGTLLVHEVERVFREGWMDQTLHLIIEAALREARTDRSIERLPVILVPEWSAATVIKGLYDDQGHSLRVCPSVYGLMAEQRQIVLPARGPYHRTDAFLLPWFEVVPA